MHIKDTYKALCRDVLDRDDWQCRVCGLRQNLSCHHIIFRSENGPDESWNILTLCIAHHDDVHDYKLSIGCAPGNPIGPGGGADGELVFTKWGIQ